MMSDFMAQPKRQPSREMDGKRHALKLIKPFVPLFEGWNQRAAKATATALSHLSTSAERAKQAQGLAALYQEVDEAYNQFERTVAGELPHSRIEDVRAAFLRLRTVLHHWREPTR